MTDFEIVALYWKRSEEAIRTREIVITQLARPAMCELWPTSYH